MTGRAAEYAGSWRTAIRIARRSAWRNKGRSALIMLMLFLPACAATILVASWANLSGTSAQEVDFNMGRADLIVDDVDGVPAILPPGSRTLPVATGRTVVTTADGLASYEYEAVDVTDPLTTRKYVTRAGTAPHGTAEVAVSRALADELGIGLGDQVDAGMPQRRMTVVGIIDVSRSLSLPALVVPADAPLSTGARRHLMVDLPHDASTWTPPEPTGPDSLAVGSMSRAGAGPSVEQRALEVAAATLVTTFAGAQVVLLAGAAFMVGARRQRRELAMVASVGATGRQVGRIVLAGGLVLGAGAATAGVVLGLLTFELAGPAIERVADHPLVDVAIPGWQVAVVAALTMAIGLLAALLPARGVGRRPVRAELGGLRSRPRSGLPGLVGGLVLVAVGAVALFVAATPNGRVELIAAGTVAQLLGVVGCAPAVVRGFGRFATNLPLAGRLALRHAARHRLRTGAAVAAVTAAVAGSVALTLVSGAQGETPPVRSEARPGQILLPAQASDLLGPDGVRRLAQALPTRATTQLRLVTGSPDGNVFIPMFLDLLDDPETAETPAVMNAMDQRGIAVGDAETIRMVTGREATGAELDLLRQGGAVLFNDTLISRDAQVSLATNGRQDRLPAVLAARGEYFTSLPGVLISEATASRLGYTVTPGNLVVETTRAARPDELARATTVLLRAQLDTTPVPGAPVEVKLADGRGRTDQTNTMFYVLAALSLVVTVTASIVAVGLAASELRGDLSTMTAVGATPRVRRWIAAAQAAVVVGIGAPLGLLAGIGPAAGYVAYSTEIDWHTPWLALFAVVVLPPALAVLLAWALHRTRLPLVRRTP